MKYGTLVIFLSSLIINSGCATTRQNQIQLQSQLLVILQEQKVQVETQKEIKTKLMELEKMLQGMDTKIFHALVQKGKTQISRPNEISNLMTDQDSELGFKGAEKPLHFQRGENVPDEKQKMQKIDRYEQITTNSEEASRKITNQNGFNKTEKMQAAKEIKSKINKKEITCAKHKEVMPDYLYENALQAFNKQEYETTLDLLSDMVNCFPDHKLISSAYFWQGEACYQLQDFENAILQYNKVIESYSETSKYPASLLKSGLSNYAMDNKSEGQSQLEELIRKFPNRVESKRAEIFLKSR